MHLNRVLIVVGQRSQQDRNYPGCDLRHLDEPLRCSGLVDNIDVLYYSDYLPHCDEALINYCLQNKPRAVLLSLQNIGLLGPSFAAVRKEGEPTPDAISQITRRIHIPTAVFWGDILMDSTVDVLERYHRSVTLNVILGSNPSSHRPMSPEVTNYIYVADHFDERLFDIPEGSRDIPVGFHGNIHRSRPRWMTGLNKAGISIYRADGKVFSGKQSSLAREKDNPPWVPYDNYCQFMSRLKIAVDFTPTTNPKPAREQALQPIYQNLRKAYLKLKRAAASKLNQSIMAEQITSTLTNLMLPPKYALGARVWEALWLRTFLLEEDNPVTATYFEPYVDYVPFTSLKDLADKIRYYLAHDEERDRIRMHGRATTEKYYNSSIYWENIFEALGLSPDRHYHHPAGEIWNKAYYDGHLSNVSLGK